MRVLFRFRDLAPEKIISTVLAASSSDALKLLEAFARTHPDELASGCLERLPGAPPELAERLQYVLWHVAKSPTASEATLEYAMRVLYSEKARGMDLIWSVRIFLARRSRHRHLATVTDFEEKFSEILAVFQPATERAAILLRAHLHVNEESDHLAEDYLYLLEEDFDAALAMLDDQILTPNGLSSLAFAAIDDFLTPSRVSEPMRLGKYSRIVELLDRYLDRHFDKAAALMAKAVFGLVEAVGREKYAFSADEAQEMGLLELAIRILRIGGAAVWFVCSTVIWPSHWHTRKTLFRELRKAPLSDGDVESLIKTLCNNDHVVDPRLATVYLTWLRTEGRELAWDEAARRFLFHAEPERDPLAELILAHWRALPNDRQSLISQAVMARIADGCSLRDAADPRGPAGVRWRAELRSAA
jgi:hypothetical protein